MSQIFERIVKRKGDSMARLGGDEFSVVLNPINSKADVELIANQIISELRTPIMVRNQEVKVGCSIGIAVYLEDGNNYEDLTRHADIAMYKAKEKGRSTYVFYQPEFDEIDTNSLKLEVDLDLALEKQEFVLHYQPKWELFTGRFQGFEALIRWQRNGELVPPMEFIPQLEKTSRIIGVGMWIIESAMQQIADWSCQHGRSISIAVNVSAKQIMQSEFVDQVLALKQRYDIPEGALQLEITESTIMQDPVGTAGKLHQLQNAGVTVALDDFGTGFSSLSYLRQFQLHTLKIDRSFIREVVGNAEDKAIVTTILSLAEKLGMDIVLEGIETQQQVQELKRLSQGMKNVYCQGFLVSPPVDSVMAEGFIDGNFVLEQVAS